MLYNDVTFQAPEPVDDSQILSAGYSDVPEIPTTRSGDEDGIHTVRPQVSVRSHSMSSASTTRTPLSSTRDAQVESQPEDFRHDQYDPDVSVSQDMPGEDSGPRRVKFNDVILPPGGLTGIFLDTLNQDDLTNPLEYGEEMYDNLTNPDFGGDDDNADNSNMTTLEDSIESHVSLNDGTHISKRSGKILKSYTDKLGRVSSMHFGDTRAADVDVVDIQTPDRSIGISQSFDKSTFLVEPAISTMINPGRTVGADFLP